MKKVIAFYVIAVIVIVSGVCAFIYFFPSKTKTEKLKNILNKYNITYPVL